MTDEPFTDAFTRIREDRDLSLRDVAALCQKHWDGWGSIATLSQYQTGKLTPTSQAIERIAAALNLPANHFAEYRLAVARDQLDPEQVPLRVALENLGRFNRGT